MGTLLQRRVENESEKERDRDKARQRQADRTYLRGNGALTPDHFLIRNSNTVVQNPDVTEMPPSRYPSTEKFNHFGNGGVWFT